MSSKYIDNNTYAMSGYALSGNFQSVTIGPAGTIGGIGLVGGTKEAYTIDNLGAISSYTSVAAVQLKGGRVVLNGAGASIAGLIGIEINGPLGYVGNSGTISAISSYGVLLAGGGTVNNNAHSLIKGGVGVEVAGAAGTVANGGTIMTEVSVGEGVGVRLFAGGRVTNNAGALIKSKYGIVILGGTGSVSNGGTIAANGDYGVYAGDGGIVTNSGKNALIKGLVGVAIAGNGTITNFGTIASIAGVSGTAIQFNSSGDLLVDEPGALFVGQAIGDGGTLALAGNGGTLSGLGTVFTAFRTVGLSSGKSWILNGSNTIVNGTDFVDDGIVTLTNGGTIAGTLPGTGTLAVEQFAYNTDVTINPGAAVSVSNIALNSGTITLDAGLTYSGEFIEDGGDTSLGGYALNLKGPVTLSGGTASGAGSVNTTGTTSLLGSPNTVDGFTLAGATWNNSGVANVSGYLFLDGGRLVNAAGGIFDITADIAVEGGNVVNAGRLEKTGGTGSTGIVFPISNTGTILVTSGGLRVAVVNGTGSMVIGSGSTIGIGGAVASTQTVSFAAATGDLVLDDYLKGALTFKGVVAGFGGQDTIDIPGIAGGSETFTFVQNGNEGTLKVQSHSTFMRSALITLFGQYVASAFSEKTDPTGGTLIIYTPPAASQHFVPANPHH